MKQRQVVTVVVASAVAVAGVTVIVLARPSSSPAPGPAAAAGPAAVVEAGAPASTKQAGPPIAARLTKIDIAPADPKARRVDVPRRSTARFSLIGLTWTDPAAPVGGVQVRTRAAATGAWSSWHPLAAADSLGASGAEKKGARGATDPLWVGPSDGVAARVLSATGRAANGLPAGLRLDLVNPDPSGSGGQGGGEPDPSASAPAPSAEPSASVPAPTVSPTVAPPTGPTAPLPAYVTRAGWQADEAIVKDAPGYGTAVKVVFVHHTAGTNSYTCAESPSIIRAIETYHVLSQGWNDIGYNFLTDKCGTLYEGRKGGADQPVIGAHTYGFNTDSTGIAVLGTYNDAGVPAATATTIAQVAAARLGAYGFGPATTAQLVEGVADGKYPLGQLVTFNRVAGHRDGIATECPGTALYAQLPAIATAAATGIFNLTLKTPPAYAPGTVTLTWSLSTPSELVARFELLVDGKVAGTATATARSAAVKLAAGSRKVQVRAVHINGASAETAPATVVSDPTAPTFPTAPWLSLRNGTVSSTAIPVTLNFKAADTVKLVSLAATKPTAATLATTATTWSMSVKPGAATTWSLTAKDVAGNATTAALARTTTALAETSATRTGAWSTVSNGSYLGGKALSTGTKGRKLTWTFTGRAASLIFNRTSKTGKADIYVDGKKLATIDTKSTSTSYRQAMWSKTLSGGKHTIAVVVLATSGRPTVISDGLSYVK